MKKELNYLIAKNTYPYKNLAIEEYLTNNVKHGTVTLFLWQNRNTVVIGRNQDCRRECRVNELEQDGGFLVRRLSGGGAVYHDMGNLNFTFCACNEDYNLYMQLNTIIEACRSLGINAERTGRNDITCEGRKFSGNAFYRTGNKRYHHGTLMISTSLDDMDRYLNVNRDKLVCKGISSVKSRVVNLEEFRSDLSISIMTKSLIHAFSKIYGLEAAEIYEADLPAQTIAENQKRFENKEWNYGVEMPFEYAVHERYSWGDALIRFHINDGIVSDVNFASDAMDEKAISEICNVMRGIPFNAQALLEAIHSTKRAPQSMINDISALIDKEFSAYEGI